MKSTCTPHTDCVHFDLSLCSVSGLPNVRLAVCLSTMLFFRTSTGLVDFLLRASSSSLSLFLPNILDIMLSTSLYIGTAFRDGIRWADDLMGPDPDVVVVVVVCDSKSTTSIGAAGVDVVVLLKSKI